MWLLLVIFVFTTKFNITVMKLKSIGTAMLAVAIFSGCNTGDSMQNTFYSEVKSVNKLVLAQMTISKMATIDDLSLSEAKGLKQSVAAIGDAMKIGNRKAAYSYDTYMRAFIDLTNLQPTDVTVDESSKTITLTLPAIQTEYIGRDAEIREDHYRVTGLRSEIDAEERAKIKEQMNTALKTEVEQNPTFRDKLSLQARGKANTYFSSLAARDGYNVIVKFKES